MGEWHIKINLQNSVAVQDVLKNGNCQPVNRIENGDFLEVGEEDAIYIPEVEIDASNDQREDIINSLKEQCNPLAICDDNGRNLVREYLSNGEIHNEHN